MSREGHRLGAYLSGFAALLGILLFTGILALAFARQHSINERLCEQAVDNRDALRGIWQGARRLSLDGVTDPFQRAELNSFFADILRPYPKLECHGATLTPVAAALELELVSYTIRPHGKPHPSPAAAAPCIPFLPITCPPPPSQPPPSSPESSDDPPQMVALFVDDRTRRTVRLGWETALDEEGVVGYRIYRDSVKRAFAGPRARRAWVWLPCGLHIYAVEAVDTSGQRDAMSLAVRRRCH